MKARSFTIDPSTLLDADGIAQSQTPSGAGALTLNGAFASGGVATLSPAGFVTISSSSNISNRTFTVTGTGFNGATQSQTITGPNNSTVATTLTFKTITSITISGSAAGALTVGTNGTLRTAPFVLNYAESGNVGFGVALSSGASLTYSIQHTFDDLQASPTAYQTATWFNNSYVNGATGNADGNYMFGVTAMSLLITAYTSGTIQLKIVPTDYSIT